ncbi:MAG: hypothetical protein ACOVLB_06345 [Candidatus Nanopelagicus sp.]
MKFIVGEIVTLKLSSGEEMVTKIVSGLDENNFIEISEPVSIAPNQQGLGMVPSLFTSDMSGKFMLNTSTVAMYATTGEQIKMKYIEATTGLVVPEKKILVG